MQRPQKAGRHLPDSSELKKTQPFARESAHSAPSLLLPPPASRGQGDAIAGQKASKLLGLASPLIRAPTPKHRHFAPRPTHLTLTAGRWVSDAAAARRAHAALAGPRGGDGGRGGGRRSAVPGRQDNATSGLAAAAGL